MLNTPPLERSLDDWTVSWQQLRVAQRALLSHYFERGLLGRSRVFI